MKFCFKIKNLKGNLKGRFHFKKKKKKLRRRGFHIAFRKEFWHNSHSDGLYPYTSFFVEGYLQHYLSLLFFVFLFSFLKVHRRLMCPRKSIWDNWQKYVKTNFPGTTKHASISFNFCAIWLKMVSETNTYIKNNLS